MKVYSIQNYAANRNFAEQKFKGASIPPPPQTAKTILKETGAEVGAHLKDCGIAIGSHLKDAGFSALKGVKNLAKIASEKLEKFANEEPKK